MLRIGRFRHRLLDDEFLKSKSPLASQCLAPFLNLWQQKHISDVEIVAIYVFIFSFLRRPKDFFGGIHNATLAVPQVASLLKAKEVIELLRPFLPCEFKNAKSLARLHSDAPFLEVLCQNSLRSIPLAVSTSLMAWHSGHYPLQLLTYIPTPDEVLRSQAKGIRCVSMLIIDAEIQSLVSEGRDVLGFIIHDLIHAEHFFADGERARAQVLFCQKLIQVKALPKIRNMFAQDPLFVGEFDYLSSDMNSVSLHLLKTLKAILLGHFKRRENLLMSAPLSPPAELEFNTLYTEILNLWPLSPQGLQAAYRLNTATYKGLEDSELLTQQLLL